MKKTALLLGLHCHQPVDNFHHVLDEAIEKSYYPFLEVASKYKDFKFSVHYSGWLLEFIKEKSPKTFSLMKELSKNGQIEFLTGGFYEPILAAISSQDRIAQIKKLNTFIEENFDQSPKGLWLTERVWDSVIIKDVLSCGIEYVVVDDYHFVSSGFDEKNLHGYFITEDEGEKLKIFPINKELRYTMPFAKPDTVCEYLQSIAKEDISGGIIFDDGEKFGIWPDTYEWVYEKGWLEEFIQKSLANDTIKPMLYREYLEITKPISLAYLPITSYIEMGSWSLEGDDANKLHDMQDVLANSFDKDIIEKYLKGSIWKNFLVKYYEANKIHKRYIELSKNRVDDPKYLDALYKAQTNDALWHGVFGGTYLPNLRDNAYRFIIDCENIRYYDKNVTEILDINCDGYDEVKCVDNNLIIIFDSGLGGQLIEFDVRDKYFNFQNTMSRYYESYHKKIIDYSEVASKKKGIKEDEISTIHGDDGVDLSIYQNKLKHDWHTKNSFIDHIVDEKITLESFHSSSFSEYGDFANSPFEIQVAQNAQIQLQRKGFIEMAGEKYQTTLDKLFSINNNQIDFEIMIDSQRKGLFYLQEHNFHFANLKDIKINETSFDKNIKIYSDELIIHDAYTSKTIKFKLSQKIDIFLTRLDTLSQSESGFDLTNQGLSIGLLFKNENITGNINVND